MGKRPAGVELFEGNMVSMQRGIRPSMQRDEPPTMETGLERIADKFCESTPEERSAGNLHATFCGRRRQVTASAHPVCALKAHETMSPEMATAVKLSRQPRTESCVVSGNGLCEA